ncbi:MAG: alpha-2-macroglobulin, partial [Spirochaetaceae bacterium]|nr:alpha-2-macroglobulin [Spirochaetaceae bacterium]
MKTKQKSVSLLLVVLSVLFLFTNCSKKTPEDSAVLASESQTMQGAASSVTTEAAVSAVPEKIPDEYLQDTFINPDDFFTLDYTPYLPESEAAVINKTAQASNAAGKSGQGDQSVIPGLRAITDYKTDYSEKKMTSVGSSLPVNMQTGSSLGSFSVEDWGPQGTIPSDVKRPSFYVLFSEPIVPLAALSEQSSVSPYMEIDPPLKGVFRWYGTSLLSFDATENCNPRQVYTIKLNPAMRSVSGKTLTGTTEFSTEAAPLEIEWFQPGYEWSIENKTYVSNNDVPPEAAKELRVQFNYDVKADDIKNISLITIGYKKADFTVTQSLPDTVTYHITSPIPFETKIQLKVTDGDLQQTASYSSLKKFTLSSSYKGTTYGKYTNPVNIYMTHPVKADTVLPNITTQPYMPIKEENISISGENITLYGLPVTFGDTYTIILNTGITDMYGRNLDAQKKISVSVPDASSYVQFQNSGIQILEAQFPHKMLFEYQNILGDSRYKVVKTDTPLDAYRGYNAISIPSGTEDAVELKTEPRNQRLFEEVLLDPYLKNGKGSIRFEAQVKTKSNYSSSIYTSTNSTTIQVTDLGVTARMGVNKTAVLVSKLSDGKPVEGATVYLYNGITTASLQKIENGMYFAKAVSDKNGLAVLEYDTAEAVKFFDNKDYSRDNTPAIYVTTADDAVTFFPESHSPWRDGVYYTSDIASALTPQQKTFMFCDRGLYKPGETVTFRGIDRNRQAGSYTPYNGNFTVVLEDSYWWNAEIYDKQAGTTSESGGFYGSFTLPEDLEPGTYKIRYTREGSTKQSYYDPYIEIKIAYFERLKFQTALEMPSTPVISGDNIPASLTASYLAGGALSSASYEASWFREPWYFTSDEPEFKNFRFGPSDTSESRTYIDDSDGSLDAEGKAELSCKTGGENLKGTPYRYRVSASVTDASNQQIGTAGATIVHPASFYAGLSKQASAAAFARTNETQTFKYKLAFPDGTAVSSRDNVKNTLLSLAGDNAVLEISLIRTEWNLVKQQGIAGNVYSRYEKEEVVDSSSQVKLEAEGTINITPKKAGYHTLRIETKDSSGRSVITDYTFFVTGSVNSWWYSGSTSSMKLTPDQSQYNPGDTAHILLESPLPSGDYLITTEREGIFTEEVRHFDSSIQVLDIPVARNYVPVFYLSISSYSVRTEAPHHEYGEKDVDKPQGYFGVTPIYVNPYVKAFSLSIDTGSDAYRPGEEATVTITATKGGKPLANAEITLMAVDRGVLDLINYHVPDPISFYYNESNFPLCVK